MGAVSHDPHPCSFRPDCRVFILGQGCCIQSSGGRQDNEKQPFTTVELVIDKYGNKVKREEAKEKKNKHGGGRGGRVEDTGSLGVNTGSMWEQQEVGLQFKAPPTAMDRRTLGKTRAVVFMTHSPILTSCLVTP